MRTPTLTMCVLSGAVKNKALYDTFCFHLNTVSKVIITVLCTIEYN